MLASVSGFGRGVHEFIAGKPISLIDLPWILDKQQGLDFEPIIPVIRRFRPASWTSSDEALLNSGEKLLCSSVPMKVSHFCSR